MAKNRVMAEKNARVRKADIQRKKERQAIEIGDARYAGEIPQKILEYAGYMPNYNGKRNHKGNFNVTPKLKCKAKSSAKVALLKRI